MKTIMCCTFCLDTFSDYAHWYEHLMKHVIGDANMSFARMWNAITNKSIYQVQVQ